MSQLLAAAVRQGIERTGMRVSDDAEMGLVTYLELLSRWNRKINLTAFDLAAASDEAIDRLIGEPLVGAQAVWPEDRTAVDIGSGGGSPALPLALACPWLRMTLFEVRQRKAAFLREAIRVLDLHATVEVGLFEAASVDVADRVVDVVSMRAVRPDRRLISGIGRVLAADGRLLWFGKIGDIAQSSDLIVHRASLTLAVHVLRLAAAS